MMSKVVHAHTDPFMQLYPHAAAHGGYLRLLLPYIKFLIQFLAKMLQKVDSLGTSWKMKERQFCQSIDETDFYTD